MMSMRQRKGLPGRCLHIGLLIVFVFTSVCPPGAARAQSEKTTVLDLPVPGTMVVTSPVYNPAIIRGITINSENPFQFDFIIDTGDDDLQGDELVGESTRLIKYFLASLTVPEDEMWVNLSPYEKNRIIPDGFGRTEMGRDLLAQDYLLKQLTASMIYPEDELGQAFWDRVYTRARAEFGTDDIPVNTFNKIWIVPDRANVYVNGQSVFVVESRLKVMLEEDYLALEHHSAETAGDDDQLSELTSDVVREILIPEIQREVNEGRTFANLRQIYHAMILAAWYKKNLQQSFLNASYVNKGKTEGIENDDKQINQKIYDQYVEAFKEGVYNYVREEYDPEFDEVIPKKYFSGGVDQSMLSDEMGEVNRENLPGQLESRGRTVRVSAGLNGRGGNREFTFQQVLDLLGTDQFSLRRSYRLGEPQTLLEMSHSDLIDAENKIREELGVEITDQVVEAFRRNIQEARNRENTVETLIALRPLVGAMVYSTAQYEIPFQTQMKVQALEKQLGSIPSSPQRRQALVNEIIDSFESLSTESVAGLIRKSLANLQQHISINRRDFADWGRARINLRLNADETYAVRSAEVDGETIPVLEVDAVKMLLEFYHVSSKFSWNMGRYNVFAQDALNAALESADTSDFVRNNPDLVREVVRILMYVDRDIDRKFLPKSNRYISDNGGRTDIENVRHYRRQFFRNFEFDQGNKLYARLFKRLERMLTTEADARGQAQYVPDQSARIAEVINFVTNNPALRERAGITGELDASAVEDIQGILSAALSPDNFLFRKIGDTLDRSNGTFERNTNSPESDVVVVRARRLLDERAETEGRERTIPTSVSGFAQTVERDSSGDVSFGGEQAVEIIRRQEQEKRQREIVFVPLDVTAGEYNDRMSTGIQAMRSVQPGAVRASIFLRDVWPQFLIANALEVSNQQSIDLISEASNLLDDAELTALFNRLIAVSQDVSTSKFEIQEVARRIRNNPFLRAQGIYVQIEAVDRRQEREDGSSESVSLISSQAFKIDRVELDTEGPTDRNGEPPSILYLGDRIDRLNEDISALGFTWIGDTFGVVLKSVIDDVTYSNVLPHLMNVPFTVGAGQEVHPLSVNIRTAIQRDLPTNPTPSQIQQILEGRYESTAIHERQHTRDELNNVQRGFSGVGMRVAQETTAYLSSIAYGNTPFVDFVAVVELNISLRTGFGVLQDFFGGQIYSTASTNILKLFADRLGVQGYETDGVDMLDGNAQLLEAALKLSPRRLKRMAAQILEQVIAEQSANNRYTELAPPVASVQDDATDTEDLTDTRTTTGITTGVTAGTDVGAETTRRRRSLEFDLTLSERGKQRLRRAAAFIAMTALIWFGTYVKIAPDGPVPTTDWITQEEELQIVDTYMLPDSIQDFLKFDGFRGEGRWLDLDTYIEFGDQILDSEVYKPRPQDSIVTVDNASSIRTVRGSTLSGIAKMYFDDYFMYPSIHSANQSRYNLDPVADVSDIEARRGFYNLPQGIDLTVPGGIDVTYKVQPGDSLGAIAQRFYGLDVNGQERPLVEFDGVGDRWIWQRIAERNNIPAPYNIREGQDLIIPTSLLEYRVNVLNRSDSESDTSQVDDTDDKSMLADGQNDFRKGGIDLNPNNMEMTESGTTIEMEIPAVLKPLQNTEVDGFVPVIINITPINIVPFLLGEAEDQRPETPANRAGQETVDPAEEFEQISRIP